MRPNGIITLTTDFGQTDSYIGSMKGVILAIAPDVRLVDITHAIGPQDTHQAAYILKTFYHFFPPGTIHLVIVDPGVGSQRRAIAFGTPEAFFVAPDNGILTHVWRDARARWAPAFRPHRCERFESRGSCRGRSKPRRLSSRVRRPP